MQQRHSMIKLALAAEFLLFSTAWAAPAGRIVEIRRATMTVQAGTFAALTAMVTGKQPYDAKRAQILSDRAVVLARITSETFPESSKDAPNSNTRPDVWSERKDFDRMMTAYLNATVAVASAAKTGNADGVRQSVIEVGKTCRSCHEKFESLP